MLFWPVMAFKTGEVYGTTTERAGGGGRSLGEKAIVYEFLLLSFCGLGGSVCDDRNDKTRIGKRWFL